jgi:hypothetical protein
MVPNQKGQLVLGYHVEYPVWYERRLKLKCIDEAIHELNILKWRLKEAFRQAEIPIERVVIYPMEGDCFEVINPEAYVVEWRGVLRKERRYDP